jgi:hypothetical protein
VDKLEILREIKRTAEENGGTPLGWRKFRTVTGISDSEWLGKHWARWSDAIAAAGLAPNEMTVAYDADHLLNLYAAYALELDRLPTAADLRLKRRKDVCYPDATVYQRLCTKLELVKRLEAFCETRAEYVRVLQLCSEYYKKQQNPKDALRAANNTIATMGYVYLYQHGGQKQFKIGKTNNAIRREGELRLLLPEKLEPLHTIQTDDPAGVELYWHRRFATKRLEGEWFALSVEDVRAFKRWRRIY